MDLDSMFRTMALLLMKIVQLFCLEENSFLRRISYSFAVALHGAAAAAVGYLRLGLRLLLSMKLDARLNPNLGKQLKSSI